MANIPQTATERLAAQEELSRLNAELGYPRRDPQDSPRGEIGGPTDGENHAPPPADSPQGGSGGDPPGSTPKDPGPPRFLVLDIENKLAQLAGGAIIPVDGEDVRACVHALLHSLRLHMAASYGAVATSHKVESSEQLEIPFGEPSGNSA